MLLYFFRQPRCVRARFFFREKFVVKNKNLLPGQKKAVALSPPEGMRVTGARVD